MEEANKPKKTTIKDVARRAEVSTTTVSRVLNNHPRVSEISLKTQQRVWEAVQSLGYVPNSAGRRLRLGFDFFSMGILFSKGMEKLSNEPFFWSVVEGIYSGVGGEYQCIHLDRRYLTKFGGGQILNEMVRGVITVDYIDDDLMNILKEYRGPVVCVFPGRDVFPFISIEADDKKGVFEIIKYLSDLGHKRLAFVSGYSGDFERPVFKDRYRYCLKAAEEYGITEVRKLHIPNWHVITRSEESHSEEEALLIRDFEGISAIIAANDYIALWLIRVLTSNGINVPRDISIVGYDNIYLSSLSYPTLSTVEIPAVYAGRMASEICLKIIGHYTNIPLKQFVKTKLIIRESSCEVMKRD